MSVVLILLSGGPIQFFGLDPIVPQCSLTKDIKVVQWFGHLSKLLDMHKVTRITKSI